jgi:hypothetical protein
MQDATTAGRKIGLTILSKNVGGMFNKKTDIDLKEKQ